MKSAAHAMLNKTAREVWRRGEVYLNKGKVAVAQWDDREIKAVVSGTSRYQVLLRKVSSGFTRRCDCPHAGKSAGRVICKHLVATALTWDGLRGLPRPTSGEVEEWTIPPPDISRKQINALFADPLCADLDLLRCLSEAGNWSRAHARLPNTPRVNTDPACPIRPVELRRAFETIHRWANRSLYDPYFCAGEMMAAFCEVLRIFRTQIEATPPAVAAEVLITAQRFHRMLILELIDDSDGLHQFGEAHLDDLFRVIKEQSVPHDQEPLVQERLKTFETDRNNY